MSKSSESDQWYTGRRFDRCEDCVLRGAPGRPSRSSRALRLQYSWKLPARKQSSSGSSSLAGVLVDFRGAGLDLVAGLGLGASLALFVLGGACLS